MSFNAIKNAAFGLLVGDLATGPLLEKLMALFLTSPCQDRKGRNPPRVKTFAKGLLDFQRGRFRMLPPNSIASEAFVLRFVAVNVLKFSMWGLWREQCSTTPR